MRALSALLLLLLLTACGAPPEPTSQVRDPAGRLVVVVTTDVLADFVRQVGGDRVAVELLVPPGRDPHTYEPSEEEGGRLRGSGVAFLNGAGYESIGVEITLDENVPPESPIIALADGVSLITVAEEGLPDEELADVVNPHAWLDPELAVQYVEVIASGLTEVDEANQAYYADNATRYTQELRELDQWIAGQVAALPTNRRKLVTDHDGLAYFARRYKLELFGFAVFAPDEEPDPDRIADLVARARAAGVRAVFVQPQLDATALTEPARQAGMEVRAVHGDTLPEGADYVAMMRRTAEEIVAGLR